MTDYQKTISFRPDEWQRIYFAFTKAYCADDGTPPPSDWYFEIASKLKQAALAQSVEATGSNPV